MKVNLSPELEELIKQDVERGPYQTVDQFVEHAVSMLHEQEAWLARHSTEIKDKIDEGYAAAQRGELMDSDELRLTLQKRKHSWLSDKRD